VTIALTEAQHTALLRLTLINDAQERGPSWDAIARTLGVSSGKQLKNDTKKLARALQRELRRNEVA
jgi:hypothetical protein